MSCSEFNDKLDKKMDRILIWKTIHIKYKDKSQQN